MKLIKKRTILIYLIGFLIARAVFYSINPLAVGYFTASYLSGMGGIWALTVSLLGVISCMTLTDILKYALTLIASLILLETPLLKNKKLPKVVTYIIPAMVLSTFSMMGITSGGDMEYYIPMAVLEGVLALISAVLFKQGIAYIQTGQVKKRMNNEQMISMAFIAAVLLYAIPDFNNQYFAPLQTATYFLILYFTYKYGAGQGAITAAACVFILSMRGLPVEKMAGYAIISILAAMVREMGRFPCSAVYLLAAFLLGLLNDSMKLSLRETGALLSAVVMFMLLPSGLIYRVGTEDKTGDPEFLTSKKLRKLAKLRMRVFSDSFLKLSKTLDTISDKQTRLKQQELDHIFEEISDKLCRNCDNCSSCWETSFERTYQAASRMFDVAEEKGSIRREDIPEDFLDSCISVDDFIAETNRGFEIAKLNHIWHSRISESREVMAEQLKEVSSVIEDITGEIYEAAEVSRMLEERVIRALRQGHIAVKDITILEREDKRKEIYMNAACRRGRCIIAREAAVCISDALGIRIKASEASKSVISKEFENYIFVEDTKFKILTGIARAMKESVSGDNFSVLPLETGEFMVALSDGMGTGEAAGEESETVMALLEQMIEAGFKPETAIKLINSSLVLNSEKQTFSTIDMGLINLFTGICEFIKIGAAASFIKRENWVETITSTTLPIGMFGNVDYDTVSKKLYEGDIIIMLTDGVLDCIEAENKEAFLEAMLMNIKSSNPQEIANKILEQTLSQRNYVPLDDMTVITAGIWLK